MSGPIFSLPPELLARVFEYLAEDRHDISSSRLVNKAFKDSSSPYLITEVVFAKRLPEIAKLHEVACHPYFSRYVTNLVYDLSFWKFNEVEMNDPTEMMEYIAACEEAEELDIRHFLDEEWARRVQAESEFYANVVRNKGEPSADDAQAFLENYKPDLSRGEIDGQSEALEHLNEVGGDSFRMGCYQSFPKYKRHAQIHEGLSDKGEYLQTLDRVVKKFPKLRAVTFTDYRGLARRGETYMELCTRLFGNMLEPERWHWSLDNGICTTEVIALLEVISKSKVGLQSMSFGPHFFEMVSFPQEPLVTYKEPHYLSIDDLDSGDPETSPDWTTLLKGLRSLRLPLMFTEATFPDENVEKLLHAIPDTIEHLALGAKGPVEGYEALEQANSQVLRPFKQLISGLRFPKLRTLELEGWCIQLRTLKDFLFAHASTLRTLHLVNIYFVSNDDIIDKDLSKFGASIAKELTLTGVEITNVAVCGPLEIPDLPAEDDTWLIPGMNDDEDWDGDTGVIAGPNTSMEARFLGGRPNNIHRRRPATAPGHKGDDLGFVPAYW
ncbi:hypothetical protein MBLNU13_g00955t1 [Cladosporium sp. NU13]